MPVAPPSLAVPRLSRCRSQPFRRLVLSLLTQDPCKRTTDEDMGRAITDIAKEEGWSLA